MQPGQKLFSGRHTGRNQNRKKAIEEIEEGEAVWCEEESTGEQKLKKVLRRIEKTNDILYHLYIGNEEIHITEDHAIWLEEEGWRKAEDIHVGDIVRCRTGEPEVITNVWMEKLPEQVKVYNLSVEDVHNYYVSEKGVLVHNECPKNNKVNIDNIGKNQHYLSNSIQDHILKNHVYARLKKTIDTMMRKGFRKSAEKLANKKTVFNPSWSEEKVIEASNIAYEKAVSQGLTSGKLTVEVFGEKITVYMNQDGVLDSIYGSYKCTLSDYGY